MAFREDMRLRKEDTNRLVRLSFEVGRAVRGCSCGACDNLKGAAPAVFLLLPPEKDQN